MPVASGSIAYLGAARFQGYWNATTNHATGSGAQQSASGSFVALFASGTSPSRGYAHGGITASAGDYWQVTGSGTHNIDGAASWRVNDWVIYSGSAGSSGTWKKLAFEDTIASIILGDLSSSSFHMGVENDKHILFGSGSVHSGSNNFVFDYVNSRVGIGTAEPTKHVHVNGASGEVELRLQSNDKFSSIVQKDNAELIIQNASAGDILFYDDGAEIFRLDASADSLLIAGTKKIEFNDSSQFIHGSATGLTLSGSVVELDTNTVQLTGSLLADIVMNRTTAATSQVVPEGYAARINGPYTVPVGLTLTINGRAEISDI